MAQKGPAVREPARRRKAEDKAAPDTRKSFLRASLSASLLLTLLAGLATAVAFWFAGYSASWRTLARFAMQVLPLMPFALIGFLLVRWFSRLLRLPRLLAIALVVLGMTATLVLAPATALAVYNVGFAASGDDLDWDGTLLDLIFTAGASLGLYLITGARLWIPYGFCLPPLAGFLYWKAMRLP